MASYNRGNNRVELFAERKKRKQEKRQQLVAEPVYTILARYFYYLALVASLVFPFLDLISSVRHSGAVKLSHIFFSNALMVFLFSLPIWLFYGIDYLRNKPWPEKKRKLRRMLVLLIFLILYVFLGLFFLLVF